MTDGELRQKALGGLIWKFVESVGAQGISFIVSLVLARILLPEEYGIVSIVMVMIALGNVFVNSGLGTALIQKMDADELDFNTVFYASLSISLILYIAMFIAAPWIAAFYSEPILQPVIRVMSFRFVIASCNTVQRSYVSKKMQFRKIFFATIGGTLVSGVVGVLMALGGYGVWALVAQNMFSALVDTIVLFCIVDWKPRLQFSFLRLKGLFSFGWKLLVSSLIDTLYNNLRSLIIGKQYSSADLAYYNKGKQFPELVSGNVLTAIDSVLFPVISLKQDNPESVKQMVRRFIKSATYIMMPMMIGLACVAEPMVRLILTDKWLFCVPYIQIYCFVGFLQPIQTANMQAIKAMGHSDVLLKLEVIKKVFGTILLLTAMPFGVLILAGSNIVYSCVVLLLNTSPNRKFLNYTLGEQILDILPNFAISMVMGVLVYLLGFLPIHDLYILALQVVTGVGVYVLESLVFRNESFAYIKDMLHSRMRR